MFLSICFAFLLAGINERYRRVSGVELGVLERVDALIAVFKVRVATTLGLHLEATRQYFGVPQWIAIKYPRITANIEDELVIFAEADLTRHLLFSPLVEADALQIVEVLVCVRLAHARANFIY